MITVLNDKPQPLLTHAKLATHPVQRNSVGLFFKETACKRVSCSETRIETGRHALDQIAANSGLRSKRVQATDLLTSDCHIVQFC